jgi:hypothetical protein
MVGWTPQNCISLAKDDESRPDAIKNVKNASNAVRTHPAPALSHPAAGLRPVSWRRVSPGH